MINSKVPTRPQGGTLKSSLPRPLLLLMQEERGEVFDEASFTSYHVFDPGLADKGLVRIFRGPGNEQVLGAITPLVEGWALARVNLNRSKEPEGESRWFWYHYPSGEIGEEVRSQFWVRERKGKWLFGEKGGGEQDGSRLVKYAPTTGVMEETRVVFSYTKWVSSSEVFGIATIDRKDRMVLFDFDRLGFRDLGPPPPGYPDANSQLFSMRMALAGKGGADGIFMSSSERDGFALWFLAKGGKWKKVVEKVNVVKTFGGVSPWLPVEYVGSGNFAVSKTIVDSVPVPDDWPEDQKMFGAAKGVTMLIEGKSGKILKQSGAFVYEHNPPLKIPEDWWSDGLKPRIPSWMKLAENESTVFKWNEEKRELEFGSGKSISLSDAEDHSISDDGRYAIVFRDMPRRGKNQKARQRLRIIDGTNGTVREIKMESDFYEVRTEAYWLESASSSPEGRRPR